MKPLIDLPTDTKASWVGMPGFEQQDLTPLQSVIVHLASAADRDALAKLLGQTITEKTRSLWYPKAEIGHYANKLYDAERRIDPKYPVYIVSKGRWETRLTSKACEEIDLPYRIVVEPQEYDDYAAVIDPKKVLTLPFSNLGLGSIPARNWIWKHSVKEGHERHWILDDNIQGFYRLHKNLKTPAVGNIFRAAEDFVDRYENVALAAFNYFMFAPRKTVVPAYTRNTRCYSCILIKNDIPYKWRGRYNEDTDLSLQVLKDGWCTILFNAFLAYKMTTMSMTGGNTDELYRGDGRLRMAESLQEAWPGIVKVVEKWGRWQHHVDYSWAANNRLKLKPGVEIPTGVDDYGMSLRVLDEDDG